MDGKTKRSLLVGIVAFLIGAGLAALITTSMAGSDTGSGTQGSGEKTEETTAAVQEASSAAEDLDMQATFPSWNQDSETLQSIVSFVQDVTDESSENYVEPADRIATFDMDGTVLCEKAPVYMDYCLLLHRVLDDPSYKADAEIVEVCKQIRANADKGVIDSELDKAKNQSFAKVFAGMTQEEFSAYVNEFLDTVDAEGFSGMTYGATFYHPMIEVMNYLRANGFDVYMVSACEREVVRATVPDRIGVPVDHIIGSDLAFAATEQGDTPANEYTMTQDDDLVLAGEVLSDCGKGNKVIYIQREIGKVPIMSFGNSSGDFAMLNYATSNEAHKGMGVLVVADDTEREYGNEEKATSMYEEAEKEGWTAVSMRDDWATIYGEGVEKTALVADLELDQAA